MKAKLLALTLPLALAYALAAQAQGTLQFHATLTGLQVVPPNSDTTVASGDFWLTGDVLNFFVDVPAETFTAQNAYIRGPAPSGSTAPILFDLGGPTFRPGNEFEPPGYRFFSPFDGTFGAGPFTLTTDQITELESGLWYVEVTSFTMPDGQLRGQILEVPEPSVAALGGLCALMVFGWRLRLNGGKVFYENQICRCTSRHL